MEDRLQMSTEFYIILKNQNILKDKVFLKGKKAQKGLHLYARVLDL